jgi:hypothetical protein
MFCLGGGILASEKKRAPELPADAAAIVNGESIPEILVQICSQNWQAQKRSSLMAVRE